MLQLYTVQVHRRVQQEHTSSFEGKAIRRRGLIIHYHHHSYFHSLYLP